jgi:hypothetical protein
MPVAKISKDSMGSSGGIAEGVFGKSGEWQEPE